MPKINQEEYEVLKELDDKWEWIARDGDGEAFMYECEPYRIGTLWDIDDSRHDHDPLREDNLFQFIQWEDEEPHNVAELIEEYEYHNEPVKLAGGLSITQAKYDKYLEEHIKELENESEEAEVRKEEIINGLRTLRGELANNYKDNQRIGFIAGVNRAIEFIHSTDEPEVLSQEWIEENHFETENWDEDLFKSDGETIDHTPHIKVIAVQDLPNLIVPEQEEITHKQVEKYLLDKNIRVIDIDIYEEMQSELEELKNGATLSKTETVADVIADFFKSLERLKEVMSMEVEELEE